MKASNTERTNALAWIRSSTAQIVFIVSPAGYGKTTLAAALRYDYARSAVCDCADALTPASFLSRVLAALADENPHDASHYSELQVRIRAIEDQSERLSIVESAWHRSNGPSLFIFENAEALADNGEVASSLTRLLHSAPAERRVVICTRVPLPTRASRYLAPHKMLTVTTEQLALGAQQARDILAEQGVPEEHWADIIEIANGWPILLLLLARLAVEGRLHAISDHPELVLEELFSYLLHEVLDRLDEPTTIALTLGAIVPGLTTEELASALEVSGFAVHNIVRLAPFIHRDGQSLSVHALMREPLVDRVPEWKRYVLRIAREAERMENYARASMLYRLIGDNDSAMSVLEALSVERLMSPAYSVELATISSGSMRAHPKLALAIFNKVGFTPELREDLISIFDNLDDSADPALVANLARAIVSANWWLGDVAGNGRILASGRLHRALASDSPLAREAFLGVEECFYASLGSIESNIPRMKQAYEDALRARLPHPRTLLARKIASSERWRGDKAASMHWTEAGVHNARESGSALLYSSLLVDALMNAWFWGDDELCTKYESELESWSVHNALASQFLSLHAALRGEAEVTSLPLPRPNIVMAQLIAASHCNDRDRMTVLISDACRLAETTQELPVIALCAVASAACQPARRAEILGDTLLRIDELELPTLCAAIRAYREGKPSFIDVFAQRFSPMAITAKTHESRIQVEILKERLLIGDTSIRLSPREAGLVAYLCRQRSPVPREEIQDALWPELDERAARDSLYSLLYRMRKRADEQTIIENCGNAYRIAQNARVDVWIYQALAREIERNANVSAADVEHGYSKIRERAYSHLQQLEWFDAVDFQIRECGRIFARRLIQDALKQGDYERALSFANELIDEDNLDDWAHETVIRIRIETGDTVEAQRAYRRYCTILKDSIEAAPAPEIESLMRRHRLAASLAS